MKESELKYNIKNYFFDQTKMEYLCFWLTREGIRLLNKIVESINNMTPPTSKKEVHVFIELVNYYRYMLKNSSHMFQPLTRLMSKKG